MTLDSRVYITSKYGHEIEVYADQLLGDGKDIGSNLDMGCDEPLTQAQVEQAQWIWLRELEMLEVEQQGTDSA